MQPASGPRRGESTQVECELPSSVGHTSLNANAGVAQRRRCMSRSDMWSNGFSFFLEVLDIKREFEDEDYSCRRSRHLHKSASVFIILTRLWCFCRFNLSAFGKTLSELVFLTRERIETRYVLLFFWGGFMSELCMKGNKSEMWRVKEYLKPCSNNQCAFKKTSLAPNCTNRDSMCQSYIFLFDFQDVFLHSHLPKQTHKYCFWPWNDSVLYL